MFSAAAVEKVGTVKAYGGSTAPDGWLFCDGSAISRTTYAALFAVIGTTYGAGDGTTTFNIPNGVVPIGTTANVKTSSITHSVTGNALVFRTSANTAVSTGSIGTSSDGKLHRGYYSGIGNQWENSSDIEPINLIADLSSAPAATAAIIKY